MTDNEAIKEIDEAIKEIEKLDDWISTHPSLLNDWCKTSDALDMAIKALDIELLTDKEQRIFLKAMSREREVCQKVDDDYADDDTKVSLVKICNEIERKVKKIWER